MIQPKPAKKAKGKKRRKKSVKPPPIVTTVQDPLDPMIPGLLEHEVLTYHKQPTGTLEAQIKMAKTQLNRLCVRQANQDGNPNSPLNLRLTKLMVMAKGSAKTEFRTFEASDLTPDIIKMLKVIADLEAQHQALKDANLSAFNAANQPAPMKQNIIDRALDLLSNPDEPEEP